MYIAPNSTIYLLGGINWTPAYTDAVYFNNKTVQLNYMKNKIKRKFESQSYQRHSKNVLRILASADSLYDCNYLMFQNRFRSGTLGDKWFYAFIIDIEYVNENTADVYYEIDVIQTWFWDLKLGQCFVEREIPTSDKLFENLVPENFELGEYAVQHEEFFNLMNPHENPTDPNRIDRSFTILLTALTDKDGNYPESSGEYWTTDDEIHFTSAYVCNGIPSGLMYFHRKIRIQGGVVNLGDIESFLILIEGYNKNGIADNIVNIQIVPDFIVENALGNYPNERPNTFQPFATKVIGGYFLPTEFHDNARNTVYIPKNQKLYSYPYMQLLVSNGSGNIGEFRFENFADAESAPIKFQMSGNVAGTPTVMITPLNHKGMKADYDASILLTNFPPIAVMNDTYKAYMAQNKASLNTQVLSNIIDSGFNLIGGINQARAGVGNAITSLMGRNANVQAGYQAEQGGLKAVKSVVDIGTTIASAIAQVEGHRAAPKTVANLSQSDTISLIINHCGFTFYTLGIKPEMAKIIDDYFSAYGYAQHKFKKPNIIARTYWGYTKTKGCELIGSCPEGIKAQIAAIFDNGIRFWNSNEIIGNYSLDNSHPRAESEGN